ncbi:hypothetical protein BH20ACI2_BH20ACI2_06020 [soil metagenome]
MKEKRFSSLLLGLFLIGMAATVSFGQGTGIRSTTQQFDRLLTRIETKIDILKDEADRVSNSAPDDRLGEYLTSVEQTAATLRETFDARNPVRDDLNRLLSDAAEVDRFFARNRVSPAAQTQWKSVKRDLTTLAGYGRVSWNWAGPTVPRPVAILPSPVSAPAYTVTDSQLRTLLSRLDLKTGIYRTQLDTALRSDNMVETPDDVVMGYITRFQSAVGRLRQNFESRRSAVADATDVFTTATYLDQFMTRNRLTAAAQAQWSNLRADLNTLGTYYQVSWNWNQTLPDSNTGVGLRNFDRRITGTYRLNQGLSEDPTVAIDRAVNSTSAAGREEARANLESRLRSPEMIAIEMNNRTISMASTILPQVTFQADGVARTETNPRGRVITTTATVDEEGLIVNYQGERASDFYLTFLPMADGKLKVTRRIYLDNSSQSLTVSSVYDKTDNVARWTSVTNNNSANTYGGTGIMNDSYVIPAGTRLNTELRDPISGSPVTDRFAMEITSPGQYRGGIISGRVLAEDASSRMAGRTRILLAFDTVRLPNGQTYRFAGNVDSVTAFNGDVIEVSNQTATTAAQPTRSAGGILGALIGAIAGVPVDSTNAATTPGAILMQRRNMIDLGAGSQIMLTTTPPRD